MIVDVLGMGAVAMDLILRCEDLPGDDGFAFVHKEEWLPGGSCSNVLVTLACMGARCAAAAQVGDDSYGDAVRSDLLRHGISTEHLLTRNGSTTLHTFVAVARNVRPLHLRKPRRCLPQPARLPGRKGNAP